MAACDPEFLARRITDTRSSRRLGIIMAGAGRTGPCPVASSIGSAAMPGSAELLLRRARRTMANVRPVSESLCVQAARTGYAMALADVVSRPALLGFVSAIPVFGVTFVMWRVEKLRRAVEQRITAEELFPNLRRPDEDR